MTGATAKHLFVVVAIVLATAILLSAVWDVPYIYTIIGFAVWAFVGHVITADDDAPGGWSNPGGSLPFPWAEIAIKGAVLIALCAVAVLVPAVRSFGGAS